MKPTWSFVTTCVSTAAVAVSVTRRALRHGLLLLLLPMLLAGAARFDAAPPRNIAIGNPAAVYCASVMGFDYEIVVGGGADGDAERGICVLPGGTACDQWDFYSGLCGQDYSYCARQGYGIEVRRDGQDPFSPTYAVCVSPAGKALGSVAKLSDLSSQLTTACPPQVLDLHIAELAEPLADDDELVVPSSFDWRNYQGANWMTSVKNQGGCGSCWAFSAVGVAEAHYKIFYNLPNLNINLSEQDLLSCSGAGSCSGGHSGPALAYMQATGVVDEDCMPYAAQDLACVKCPGWENRLTLIDERAQFIPSLTSLRRRLLIYGPIWVYMGIGDFHGGYFDSEGRFRCTRDSNHGYTGVDHAVIVVGYNDGGGYWIVRNSWGASWNGDGYFKVAYGACNIDRTWAGYTYSAPPTHASDVGPDGWTGPYTNNPSPSFRWSAATDTGSGMLGYYVAVDRGTPSGSSTNDWWVGNVTAYTVPSVLSEGRHTFAVTSKDRFGNVNPSNTGRLGDAPYYTFYVDTHPPTSSVLELPSRQEQPAFTVGWSGSDAGTGIANYDIQYRVGSSGSWMTWLSATSANAAVFVAPRAGTYYFRSRARDRAGNVESWPTGYGDTHTQVGLMLYLPLTSR